MPDLQSMAKLKGYFDEFSYTTHAGKPGLNAKSNTIKVAWSTQDKGHLEVSTLLMYNCNVVLCVREMDDDVK